MTPRTAMVLAAGLGTRMRDYGGDLPKPLVSVAGVPLIDRVLDRLAGAGVETAVINLHHKADRIESHLAGRSRPRVVFSDERARLLDTGGGVVRALPMLGREPFFVHNADSIWTEGAAPALGRMGAEWDAARMDCLLMLALAIDSTGYRGRGDFALAADGRVTRRRDGGVVPFVFTGVSLAHPRLFDGSPEGPFSLNLLWDRALAAGRLYGMRHDGIWMHVGTPEAVVAAERCLERGTT
jgi:MurNAc alpha-1-phosphate uridylyltransferase